MDVKETIKSQYLASLEMLRQAIEVCPESLWYGLEDKNPFWQTAYHVLFYTDLYLQPREEDFVPWGKHREWARSLASSGREAEGGEPYSKEDVLAYHGLCCAQVEKRVTGLDLEAESGFYWLPFDKFELQIYNIRHIQQHTGELYERLGAHGEFEVRWVGMKSDR
jgi:hypothetical protein